MCKLCRIIYMAFFGAAVWLSILIKNNTQYKKEMKKLKFYLKSQDKYINYILEKEDAYKGFRHDVRHHINMLGDYINNGDIEAAKEYILKIKGVIEYTKKEIYTGIASVDAIISEMHGNMDKSIEFIWEGIITDNKKIDVYDMCTLFVNIISNATEACNKCIGKRYIIIKVYQYNDVIKIYEENTFDGNIKADKEGKLITTKEDSNNHGIGSKNIRRVVKKYGGIMKIHYDDKIFKINITI